MDLLVVRTYAATPGSVNQLQDFGGYFSCTLTPHWNRIQELVFPRPVCPPLSPLCLPVSMGRELKELQYALTGVLFCKTRGSGLYWVPQAAFTL